MILTTITMTKATVMIMMMILANPRGDYEEEVPFTNYAGNAGKLKIKEKVTTKVAATTLKVRSSKRKMKSINYPGSLFEPPIAL